MAFHIVVALGKLMLVTGGGGHSHCKLFLSLLCAFALKLPLAVTCFPSSGVDLCFFLFRLNRIFLDETVQQRRGQWERAVRLIYEGALARTPRTTEETFNAISMLAL